MNDIKQVKIALEQINIMSKFLRVYANQTHDSVRCAWLKGHV